MQITLGSPEAKAFLALHKCIDILEDEVKRTIAANRSQPISRANVNALLVFMAHSHGNDASVWQKALDYLLDREKWEYRLDHFDRNRDTLHLPPHLI